MPDSSLASLMQFLVHLK